jgi:hypothetical protein
MRLRGLLAIPILAGCQHDPYTTDYAKEEPAAAQLVGGWKVTQQSLTRLNSTGSSLKPDCLSAAGKCHCDSATESGLRGHGCGGFRVGAGGSSVTPDP